MWWTRPRHRIDPVDLVSFIRFGCFTAIEDLIQSSTELFFKHGTLSCAWTACVDLAWDSLPLVTLGLEFRNSGVSIFFDLLLGARGGDVAVRAVLFEEPVSDRSGGLRLLARAIAEARLPRRATGRAGPGQLLPAVRPGRSGR